MKALLEEISPDRRYSRHSWILLVSARSELMALVDILRFQTVVSSISLNNHWVFDPQCIFVLLPGA